MKSNKMMLRIETLEDRNMLSASPMGEIAATMPDPTPKIVLRWEKIAVPVVEETEASSGGTGKVQPQDIHFPHDGTASLSVKLEDLLVSGAQGDAAAAGSANGGVWKTRDGGTGTSLTVELEDVLVSSATAGEAHAHTATSDAIFLGMGVASDRDMISTYDLKAAKRL